VLHVRATASCRTEIVLVATHVTKASFFAASQSTPPPPRHTLLLRPPDRPPNRFARIGEVGFKSEVDVVDGKMRAEKKVATERGGGISTDSMWGSTMSRVQEAQRLRDGFARHPCSPALSSITAMPLSYRKFRFSLLPPLFFHCRMDAGCR
jgi:hypothetical protein